MSAPITAAQLLTVLKAEGVNLVQMAGWTTHNRNSKGAFGEVHGILIHHTAGVGSGMPEFCYNGTASLPGPLCHAMAAKSGKVYLVGHGRANHAGTIAQNAYNAILNESSTHPRPDAAEPLDGNRVLYGIEIENEGDGKDPYPSVQYDQAVRWTAALCRHHGWTEESVAGHAEVTRRKIDPSFPMSGFRTHVARRLAHEASWTDPELTPAKTSGVPELTPAKTSGVPGTNPPPTNPNPPAQTEVTNPMAEPSYSRLASNEPFTVLAGETKTVYLNAETTDEPNQHGDGGFSFLTGGHYTGAVTVRGTASTGDGILSVRMARTTAAAPTPAVVSVSDGDFPEGSQRNYTVAVAGLLAADQKLCVTLVNVGSAPVDVSRVDVYVQSWAL